MLSATAHLHKVFKIQRRCPRLDTGRKNVLRINSLGMHVCVEELQFFTFPNVIAFAEKYSLYLSLPLFFVSHKSMDKSIKEVRWNATGRYGSQ